MMTFNLNWEKMLSFLLDTLINSHPAASFVLLHFVVN